MLVMVVVLIDFVVVLFSPTTSTPTTTTTTTTSTTRFIATFTTQNTLNYGTSVDVDNSGIGLVLVVMVKNCGDIGLLVIVVVGQLL